MVRTGRAAPRFDRQSRARRREALIDATIESLKRDGHEGLSVRHISAEAGVSIGLINHYFPRKDRLVAAAYRRFNRQLVDGMRAAVARVPAGASARTRLRQYFRAHFAAPNLDRDVLNAWLVFWSLQRHSLPMQRAHLETYGGHVALLRGMLDDLRKETDRPRLSRPGLSRPRLNPRLAAIGLGAILDGLWVEWCLDPGNFSPREAVRLCDAWLESLAPACTPLKQGGHGISA